MSFAPDWLALREPADVTARDPDLLARAARWAVDRADGQPPVIVDLGCGTGSSVRAMAPHLPPGTRWRLVDNDARLLKIAASTLGPGITTCRQDLARMQALPLDGAHLVTASALFDLMPRAWIAALAARLAGGGIGLYAALSYDGRMHWDPPLPLDDAVTAAFNAHQRGDKGLGPALGPDAGPETARILQETGFDVSTAASPWRLGPDTKELHGELLGGIAKAAGESGLIEAQAWGQARSAACGYATCFVGHVDVLALPTA